VLYVSIAWHVDVDNVKTTVLHLSRQCGAFSANFNENCLVKPDVGINRLVNWQGTFCDSF